MQLNTEHYPICYVEVLTQQGTRGKVLYLYSEDARFEFHPGQRPAQLRFCVVFLSSPRCYLNQTTAVSYQILYNLSSFTCHPTVRLSIASTAKLSLYKLRKEGQGITEIHNRCV